MVFFLIASKDKDKERAVFVYIIINTDASHSITENLLPHIPNSVTQKCSSFWVILLSSQTYKLP